MNVLFPVGNAQLVVDEAHAMGYYSPGGRGMLALEGRVLARL
jgi:7-keto-8-aminopelargonate synthetase-like enzyme